MNILAPVLYGAKFLFKSGVGLVVPWLRPLVDRPAFIICLGLSLMAGAYLLRVSGKQAVVADVQRQAKELHAKDGAENLDLVRKQAEIVKPVEKAEQQLDDMKRGSYDKTDQYYQDWAGQPLPDAVLKRLRQR